MIQYPSLQPTLPTGFDSWAQVFTDLRVSEAFKTSPMPRCLARQPELAAPFVAEIGAAIRDKQLHRRPVEVMVRCECVVEPSHERIGGPDFVALRNAMESAQENYFASRRTCSRDRDASLIHSLPAEVSRAQSAYAAMRERHRPFVEQSRRAAARDYWANIRARGLDDDFFADLPADSIIARMSRIEPAWWWRSFFTKLQIECADHHAADGCFVDAIPILRAGARKKKLAATITEWCEARADDWGWDAPRHYRMLALRAEPKAKRLVDWFDQRAPAYLSDPNLRQSLHAHLALLLSALDPMATVFAAERDGLSAHWRN
jgi:hypothetical protein